jgi:hypothetical protein
MFNNWFEDWAFRDQFPIRFGVLSVSYGVSLSCDVSSCICTRVVCWFMPMLFFPAGVVSVGLGKSADLFSFSSSCHPLFPSPLFSVVSNDVLLDGVNVCGIGKEIP